jgi:hypothetical protein
VTRPLLADTAPDQLPPEEQALLHLQAILSGVILPFEAIEIRCLDTRTKPARKGPRSFLPTVEGAVDVAMRQRHDWDVFFGVGLRSCPTAVEMAACSCAERGADHVSRLQAVWGDFDIKNEGPDALDKLVARLQAISLPPTVLVGSGRGVHAYWQLAEATKELARVVAVNRSIRLRFGADSAVDSGRILRVAGTLNHKTGDALPVRLLAVPNDV